MAVLNFVIAALLLSLSSANPDVLQRLYGAQSHGNSAGSDAVRSGLIPAADASAFESSSSSSSSGSTSASGSIFPNVDSSADASGSGSSTGNSGRSSLSGPQSDVTLSSSQNVDSGLVLDGNFDSTGLGDVTITQEITVDVFKTVTNVIYNSIPITLTEFMKTTAVQPTFEVLSTPVDDHVFVATAPVTRTDSVTVTNTNTGYFYFTEVPTDTYTITHKAYEILQKTLTSTLQQTKVFRPTVVRTRINTEYDTQTVEYLVTNTVVVQPQSTQTFGVNPGSFSRGQQVFGQGQQVFGQGQQVFGQGQQVFGQGQQVFGQGQQVFGQGQQVFGQGQQVFGQGQQVFGQGQQVFGQGQQVFGQGQQVFGQGQQVFGQGQQVFGQGQQVEQGIGSQNFGQGQLFSSQQASGIGSAPGNQNRVRQGSINSQEGQFGAGKAHTYS